MKRHQRSQSPVGAAGITILLLTLLTVGGQYLTVRQRAAELTATLQASFVPPQPRKKAEPFELALLPPPKADFQLTIETTQFLETQQLATIETESGEYADSPLPLLIDCELAEPPATSPRKTQPPAKPAAVVTKPPTLLHGPPPPYPAELRSSRRSGTVRVRIHISPAGKPEKIEILSSTHPAFATATREHILAHWRFSPARRGSEPIAASAIQTLYFSM